MSLAADIDAARTYDAWFDHGWGAYAFCVERRALLDALPPLNRERTLDIGCGTGRFTATLETAGADVTGLDVDPAMLTVAAERVAGTLVRGDAHALPFGNDTFDLAVTVTAVEFLTDPPTALAEAARVVRPHGRLIVAALNPASPWGLAQRRRFRDQPWNQACLRTPRELDRLLDDLGPLRRHAALHTPGALPGLAIAGPLIERLGRLAPGLGAFQIRVVELSTATADR